LNRISHTQLLPGRAAHLIAQLSLFAGLIISIAAAGCSSSDTTQNSGSSNPSDSAYSQGQQTFPQKTSRGQKRSSSGNQQGFVTQEDTIEAEVVTRNHGANHTKPPKHSSKKKYYSVQLGAFRILNNADRAKKTALQRYKKPVYQFFDKPIKMYRVALGNFPKITEALKFLKMIQQQHPKEYKDAWVAEMRR
jgi:cell division protein FtsN